MNAPHARFHNDTAGEQVGLLSKYVDAVQMLRQPRWWHGLSLGGAGYPTPTPLETADKCWAQMDEQTRAMAVRILGGAA